MKPLRDRIAYGAIGWVTWPLTEIAARLQTLGIRGIEGFGLSELMPEDAELKRNLAGLDVQFVGSYFGASLVQMDRRETESRNFEITAKKVAELGGTVLALGGGRLYPRLPEEQQVSQWDCLIESVHELGRIARAHGVRLGFHPHDHTRVFREAEIRRFLRETDPALTGLTFDTAHIALAGMDILQTWEVMRSRVVHVHLKDLKDGKFTDLEGHLPLEQFLSTVRASGYSGWITIELDATEDPEGSAKKSWEQVLEWLE